MKCNFISGELYLRDKSVLCFEWFRVESSNRDDLFIVVLEFVLWGNVGLERWVWWDYAAGLRNAGEVVMRGGVAEVSAR